MKAKTLLLRLILFIPFIASQAVVGLTAEAKKGESTEICTHYFQEQKD